MNNEKSAGVPKTVQNLALSQRLATIHKAAAVDVRNAISDGRYAIAIFPVNADNSLYPACGFHLAQFPLEHAPEAVGMFKECMQKELAKRRQPGDDGKQPLGILDEVIAANTMPEEAAGEEPLDPGE